MDSGGENDPGGSVREDEARSNGETRFASPASVHVLGDFLPSVPVALFIAFFAGDWRIASRRKKEQKPEDKKTNETKRNNKRKKNRPRT